jgi:acetyl-CoA carboxylase carboxyltransferase component
VQDTKLLSEKLRAGGDSKYHEKLVENKKLFARDRIKKLCDPDSWIEDGLYANCLAGDLPADGVITGLARISGRPVAVAANDSTVKAGSWGARTVEKIIRLQETAQRLQIPVFYLVDSAGARITDQVEMFPGRRGAGRIFYNQANLSGKIPQICLLFGPSAAGGAYIPSFCDVLIMVDGNASMYLGSPRMAESVIGEKVSLEEMGGARMHCAVSGCGDFLAESEDDAIKIAQKYFSYMPQNTHVAAARLPAVEPERADLKSIIPESPARAYDMKKVISAIVDKDTFFEVKSLYAKEILTGYARLEGRLIGIVANQPMVKGGVIFSESGDKSARFMQTCNAYQIPLLFLADVPGFMIGSKVEREGIIRSGAKMIYAMSNACVPKISLIVRKAYGAGLYAMCGPSFHTDCVLTLPTGQIAVMGPEPAINAVYFNKLEKMAPEARQTFIKEKSAEYQKDVDIVRLAGELIVDHIVEFADVRRELTRRFDFYCEAGPRDRGTMHGIMPM